MDSQVQHALEHDELIDISTEGRKSGQPHRIEIRFHNIDGRLYITGRPTRPRHWYANMLTHPEFTFHLKQSTRADLPARATAIRDQTVRRQILTAIHQKLGRYQDIEEWVARSPLVAVELLVD
jgi:deazaflavin-dependent oxidoreductase (nitroreductase family)